MSERRKYYVKQYGEVVCEGFFHGFPKARRDMNLSECVYKVGSIFLQNGDFDAKTLERDRGDATVGTKNSRKCESKTRLSQP